MSGLNGITPVQPSDGDECSQDSLEALRQELKEQRAKRKACLERQKKTTFVATESAKRGTTFYDAERIRKSLEADEGV
jgi:hypothetical protein